MPEDTSIKSAAEFTPTGGRTARLQSLHRATHSPGMMLAMLRKDNVSLNHIIDPSMVLKDARYNKSTAFNDKERKLLGLRGLLPVQVESIETQVARCYRQFNRFKVPLSKYLYLQGLKERDEVLFYRLVIENLEEMCPFIYTPTVGEACREFDRQFRYSEGMYFSQRDAGQIRDMLNNWKPNVMDTVSIVVVTDGSRILGLGDLGVCGMGIPVGKLSLYVAAGGFHPATTLPVVLDCGTNNEELRNDPFYLGERYGRLDDKSFYSLADEFMKAVKDKWPNVLVQFEDFSNDHCFDLLAKYRDEYLCFNDDIQGTGVVIAAAFLNAVKISGVKAEELKVVFHGCGSAAVGVADRIRATVAAEFGVDAEKLIENFYFLDSKGLVCTARGDKLADFKEKYARHDVKEPIGDLKSVIEYVKPGALIGLSVQSGAFTEEILRLMGKYNKRPVVFPLSNPTSKAECTAEEAYKYTEGRVVFASGSPFDPVKIDNKTFYPSQGNNLYTFPGIGFGAWLCHAKKVTEGMLTAGSLALANSTPADALERGELYPRLAEVRKCTVAIAGAVIRKAVEEKVANLDEIPAADIEEYVRSQMYYPSYLDIDMEV